MDNRLIPRRVGVGEGELEKKWFQIKSASLEKRPVVSAFGQAGVANVTRVC